jgi:hypothetical protein
MDIPRIARRPNRIIRSIPIKQMPTGYHVITRGCLRLAGTGPAGVAPRGFLSADAPFAGFPFLSVLVFSRQSQ